MIVQSDIAAMKKAILKSTLKLVKNNGLHGTTVSLISKNAGVAAGTIYHYFPSKVFGLKTLKLKLFHLKPRWIAKRQ